MLVALRTAIKGYLETIHPRVYFRNDIPKNAAYPYLVYDFQATFTPDESTEQLLIEVDGWDKPTNGDSLPLETLMENVNGDGDLSNPSGLNKKILSNDEIMAVFRLEGRTILDDDDPRILRRKYTYATTVYERSTS